MRLDQRDWRNLKNEGGALRESELGGDAMRDGEEDEERSDHNHTGKEFCCKDILAEMGCIVQDDRTCME